jgi:hypothetical protein
MVYCDNLQKFIHIPMPEIVLWLRISIRLHDMFYYIVEDPFLPCSNYYGFAARNEFTNFSAAPVHQWWVDIPCIFAMMQLFIYVNIKRSRPDIDKFSIHFCMLNLIHSIFASIYGNTACTTTMMQKILQFKIVMITITWGEINRGSVKNILKDVLVPMVYHSA